MKRLVVALAVSMSTVAAAQSWQADATKAVIPVRPASGMIHGQKFVVERAEMMSDPGKATDPQSRGSHILTLRQGKDFFADREYIIFLATRKGERPDGKTYRLYPNGRSDDAQAVHVGNMTYPAVQGIQIGWRPANAKMPTVDLQARHTMRLTFGKRSGKRLPGRIYLCTQDKEKSFVAGTFTAEVTELGRE